MKPKGHEMHWAIFSPSHARNFNLRAMVAIFCSSVVLASAVIGCSRPSDKTPEKPTAPTQKSETAEVEIQNKSEVLTDEGESLLADQKLNEASGKFTEALELNPSNTRAAFWRALLKPVLEMRGIARRVRPLYHNPRFASPDAYRKFVAGLDLRQPELRRYLLAGPEDIHSPEDLHEWMDRYSSAFEFLRAELKKLHGTEFAVRMPMWIAPDFFRYTSQVECESTSYGPIHYEDEECHNTKTRLVTVGRADIDFMLIGAGYYQVTLDVMTAYRLNPVALLEPSGKIRNKENAEAVYRRLMAVQNAGELRKANPFPHARTLSQDIVAALKYLIDNQDELCRYGHSSIDNRKGYLHPFGFCLDNFKSTGEPETLRTLRAFETFLAGQPTSSFLGNGETIEVRFDRLIDQPIRSLRSFEPIRFNECGALRVDSLEPIAYLFETRKDYETYIATKPQALDRSNTCSEESP